MEGRDNGRDVKDSGSWNNGENFMDVHLRQVLDGLQKRVDVFLREMGRKDPVFSFDPDRLALIVVDMQNFAIRPDGTRSLAGLEHVVKGVNLLAKTFREKGVPVIWIRQNFTRISRGDDVGLYGHFHEKPVPSGMYNQGELTEIHPAMRVMPEDHVLFKNRYSLFAPGSSTLEVLLGELGRDQLVFCGVVTNVCVECSVRDAMQRGFQSTVVSDATTSFDILVHEMSLQIMRLFFADIRTVHEIITLLSSLRIWGRP
ncbi:MAG: hypothetical protein DRJ13_13280 [Bacteroidetes bacterium]|nr:MAG: hypothetical protein DRJ13_13280 [Bacteroidota bacterium]